MDYLVSKPEIDKDKSTEAGFTGGGQMAMMITAVEERIIVCAIPHPDEECEKTNLLDVECHGYDNEVL